MADWWDHYPVAGDSGGTATAEGGNWWEQYAPADSVEPTAVAAPPEESPPDYTAMYQEIANRQPVGESPEQAYARNIKLAADMDQENRGAVTGSAPYRFTEDVVSAGASAIVNPLLSLENKLGIDSAGDMLSQRQADYDIAHARDRSYAGQTAGGIGESLAQFAVLSAAGGGAGSALGLGGAGATALKWLTIGTGIGNKSYEDTYRDSVNTGKTEDEAKKIATATAALEVGIMAAFQMVGLGGAERAVAEGLGIGAAKGAVSKTSLQGLKKFLTQTAGELTEENLTTLTQTLAQTGGVGSWKDYLNTTVQTLGTMGLLSGSQKLLNFTEQPSRRTAKEAGLDEVVTTHKERTDLAAKLSNVLTGQQFTEQLQAAATSPEEADALLEIYKARASSAGESFDDYVGKRLKGVEKTTQAEARKRHGERAKKEDSLLSPKNRGEIEFLDEGTAIIRALESQQVNTLLHETGHLFRRDLSGDEEAIAARWSGANRHTHLNTETGETTSKWNWNRKAEEKFARGFERYLATGEAPTTKLAQVFAKFKDWLAGVYGAIKGTAIDVNISPEMRGVFDRLLTPADGVTSNQADLGAVSPEMSVNTAPTTDVDQVATKPRLTSDQSAPDNQDILSQDLADRFRGLANQTAIPEARQANYEADVAMGFPERKTWAEAEERAAQRIQADPMGELSRVVERIDQANSTGGTINLENQEETALVNRLSDMLAMDLANPESRALHRKLRFAFRSARSDQARALGYRDPLAVMDPEQRKRKNVTDAIAEPTPQETEARKNARTPEQHAEVDRAMEERYNKAKEALAKQGIDLDDIDSIVADPKKAMVVLDHLRAKSKFGDVFYEFWRNSILSGTGTHISNAVGNLAFSGYNFTVERPAEAFINLFARNKKAATFGEFQYLASGILPGVMRGWRNARASWALESSALSEELGREGVFKVDGPRGAIKGKAGRLVRAIGYRPLLAADEFAKSLTVTMEVGARAYRNGKAQGLNGQQLKDFIQQQTDDLDSQSWADALAKAEQLAFQGPHGVVADKVSRGVDYVRKLPVVGRYIGAFRDTPAAIFEEGFKRLPVLGAIIEYGNMRRSGANMIDAGMTPAMARQLIAMGALALIWDGVGGDDPWLTGAADLASDKNRDVANRARPPQSIRIGGKWYSYARIEPFATMIATTADAAKGIQDGNYRRGFTGVLQQVKNKSFLDATGDAVDAGQGVLEGDYSALEKWGSKFAASWVPNLYRQTVSAAEDDMQENRMWGEGPDRFNRFVLRTAQNAQLPFVDSTPRYDVWGRPIDYNEMGNTPATSFMFQLLSPARAKDLTTIQQADLALIRWNEKHPDNQEVYSEPQKFIKINGETQYLTDEQHAQYAEMAGQLAQAYVSGIAFDPVDPTAQQIRQIKNAFTKARKEARENLIPLWEFN